MNLSNKLKKHKIIKFQKMENCNITIIESNGNVLHHQNEHNVLNKLSVSILQCKVFLSINYKGRDVPNIYVCENELKVVTKINNIQHSFS